MTSGSDGRICGHLSRLVGIKNLKREEAEAKYTVCALNYDITDRNTMVFGNSNSVAYVDVSNGIIKIVENSSAIDPNAKRVLIQASGLVDAALIFASQSVQQYRIRVYDNAPLAGAFMAKASAMRLENILTVD